MLVPTYQQALCILSLLVAGGAADSTERQAAALQPVHLGRDQTVVGGGALDFSTTALGFEGAAQRLRQSQRRLAAIPAANLSDSEKLAIDKWIAEGVADGSLNEAGDKSDSIYGGGNPLFDEHTGKFIDFYDYVAFRHPTKPWLTATPVPSSSPTQSPTQSPTPKPTPKPTPRPTQAPTAKSTPRPTPAPTPSPTRSPTSKPTPAPTPSPTRSPTAKPTPKPTPAPTPQPTQSPTSKPTTAPTTAPIKKPITDNEKRAIDEWIARGVADGILNKAGDNADTVYVGGDPLFDEHTGKSIDLYDYVVAGHPSKPWAVTPTLAPSPTPKVVATPTPSKA